MSHTAIERGGSKNSSKVRLGLPTLVAVGAAFSLLFIAVVGLGPAGFLVFLLGAALAGILAVPRLQRGQLVVLLALLGVLVFTLATRQRATRQATRPGPAAASAVSDSGEAGQGTAGSGTKSGPSASRATSNRPRPARLD
ncbi:MAG: hypothetical protein WD278_04135 [Pirellulales bacterium]